VLSAIKHIGYSWVDGNCSVTGCINGTADLVVVLVGGEIPEVLSLRAHFAGAGWPTELAFVERGGACSGAGDEAEESSLELHIESGEC